MVICQSVYLACICGLYFARQGTGKALPLTCQLALQRARHMCEQIAFTICTRRSPFCHDVLERSCSLDCSDKKMG